MARLFRWIIRSDTQEPRTSPSTLRPFDYAQGRLYSGQALLRTSLGQVLVLLALLLMALGSVAHGLADVVRELDAGLLLTVATLGALAGWMMATIRLTGWLAGILAPLLGAAVVLVRVGRLGGKLITIVWALVGLVGEIWRWLLGQGWRVENGEWMLVGPPPEWMPVWLALTELWADIAILLDRGREWLLGLVGGNPAFDVVATALAWSLAMWAVAIWAGWTVRRHQPLKGIAPAGTLLMATFFYTGAKPTTLLTLLGVTLLLMALVRHDARERHWQTIRIDFSSDLWRDLAVTAVLLSLTLVVTAALAPSISVKKIVEFAQQLTVRQRDETESVAKSLGLEAQPDLERPVSSGVRATGMPRLHLIRPGPKLSRQVVMVIYTNDLQIDLSKSRIAPFQRNLLGLSEPPQRYYWRSITYDHYNGHGWATGGTVTLEYEAGELVISKDVPFHRVLRQEVRVIGDPDEMLHVAGTLVTADHDFSVAWRSPEDVFGTSISSTALRRGPSTGSGRSSGQGSERRNAITYRADSLVPVASEEQLRSARSDYPEWVRGRYLALPDRVPDRVLALARDLTATKATPYDRALAIESYLRAFPYTLDVPSPPFDRDVADYFLFNLQRGHCDYYATTMAVLARAAGLPARLVVGYASGTYDGNNARYIVTEADAHAWVEIYFPEYGWIEFEPTGERPPIERLAELPIEWPEPTEPLSPQGPPGPVSAVRSRMARFWWLGVLGSLALASLVGVIQSVVDGWRLRLLTPTAVVTTLYRRLQHHGRRLAVPMREGDTPYEFATSFAEHIADLARGKYWWDTLLALAVQEAQWLVRLYVQASYTPRPPNTDDQRQAIQSWRWLRWRLWVAWVLQSWRRLENGGGAGMKRQLVVLTLVIASLISVQCGGAPPATEVPAATKAPATETSATEAPTAAEVPATEGPATEAPTATEVPATEGPTATEAPATEEVPTTLDGKSLVEERCTRCHDLGRVERAKKTEQEWKTTVERMVGTGAQLNEAEQELVIRYLTETYPK